MVAPRIRPTLSLVRRYHKPYNKTPIGSNFSIIYRLPPMGVFSLFNKIKRYQVFAVGASVPLCAVGYSAGLVDYSTVSVVASCGLASTVAVFTVGQLVTNLVGVIYLSKDRSNVRIAYLDFWGERVDITHPVSSVKLEKNNFLYKNLVVDDSKFKLNLRFGQIDEPSLFRAAFGQDLDEEEM